eukprot:CAMPEP_0194357416 /NCGR_PEP_ID=MMETSP0174-20130528/4895_1 /TAXON_ID=216777 /ORGANISM="Proboscia alata, Strain PI-D3" /LENGTH=379 /DNA_ID=CAMNT_0039127425 /DNA_START=11 /DNA_END=1150 /DNA_ORIENTATION=-
MANSSSSDRINSNSNCDEQFPTSALLTAIVSVTSTVLYLLIQKKSQSNDDQEIDFRSDVVSFSSCTIAASRALESERDDALVVDPLAHILAGVHALKERRGLLSTAGTSRIAIRTKYFDDFIGSFLTQRPTLYTAESAGSTPNADNICGNKTSSNNYRFQVVHMGSGMDARAYRLTGIPKETLFYDVDTEKVLRYKQTLLAKAISDPNTAKELKDMIQNGNRRRKSVSANIESAHEWESSLLSSGFDPQRPTCWVLEGLTYYLGSDDIVSELLSKMRQLSLHQHSSLIMSVATKASVERAQASTKSPLMKSWKWGSDNPARCLTENGWTCCEFENVVFLGDEKASYGRWNPPLQSLDSGGSDVELGRKKYGIMYVTARY